MKSSVSLGEHVDSSEEILNADALLTRAEAETGRPDPLAPPPIPNASSASQANRAPAKPGRPHRRGQPAEAVGRGEVVHAVEVGKREKGACDLPLQRP